MVGKKVTTMLGGGETPDKSSPVSPHGDEPRWRLEPANLRAEARDETTK